MPKTRVVPIPLGVVKAFLLVGEGVILVDTGTAGSAPRIVEALAQEGQTPANLSLILITHGHTDHFGGAAALKEQTAAPLAVGRADAEALRRGENLPTQGRTRMLSLLQRLGSMMGMEVPPCEPDILLDDEADLSPYGVAGRVIPTPGHTPGSVSVLLADGQVLVGDLVMGGFVGRGRPGLPLVWDDPEAHRASLQRLLALQPTLVHTAHGGPFKPEEVAAWLLS